MGLAMLMASVTWELLKRDLAGPISAKVRRMNSGLLDWSLMNLDTTLELPTLFPINQMDWLPNLN